MIQINAESLIALLTLTLLEIVLGIDNIIFIAILVGKLPEYMRNRPRRLALGLPMIMRVLLLLCTTWVMSLPNPLSHTPFKSAPETPPPPEGSQPAATLMATTATAD